MEEVVFVAFFILLPMFLGVAAFHHEAYGGLIGILGTLAALFLGGQAHPTLGFLAAAGFWIWLWRRLMNNRDSLRGSSTSSDRNRGDWGAGGDGGGGG